MLPVIKLSTRKFLELRGKDARSFLQALITKDIEDIEKTGVIYAYLLSDKGRIQSDLFIYKHKEDNYLVETDDIKIGPLERLLTLYRVRRNVTITPIHLSVNFSTEEMKNSFEDPRVPSFGYRVLGKVEKSIGKDIVYSRRRMEWGIPEGYEELGDQIPLNMNGDIMNGVSFEKGCYVGQELIARTHHTGVIRRRVIPFRTSEPINGLLVDEQGKKQGRILKCIGDRGLALIPSDFIGKPVFDFEKKIHLELYKPQWWPEEVD